MPKYNVSIEKRLYCTGVIEVRAKSPDHALRLVRQRIDKGLFQTTAVPWGEPEYEDSSFDVTGDVEINTTGDVK